MSWGEEYPFVFSGLHNMKQSKLENWGEQEYHVAKFLQKAGNAILAFYQGFSSSKFQVPPKQKPIDNTLTYIRTFWLKCVCICTKPFSRKEGLLKYQQFLHYIQLTFTNVLSSCLANLTFERTCLVYLVFTRDNVGVELQKRGSIII